MTKIKSDPLLATYTSWQRIDYQPVLENLDVDMVLNRLIPGQRVLEVGCGVGHNLIRMARSGLHVEGWDINPDAIAQAEHELGRSAPNAKAALVSDDFLTATELPEPADAVVLVRVLTCIPSLADWEKMLFRAKTCLKPDGVLYVHDFLKCDESYSKRYKDGVRQGWRHGAFAVPEMAEKPEFIAYHHSEEDIAAISDGLILQQLLRNSGLSMRGTKTNMFEFLAQKDTQGVRT